MPIIDVIGQRGGGPVCRCLFSSVVTLPHECMYIYSQQEERTHMQNG